MSYTHALSCSLSLHSLVPQQCVEVGLKRSRLELRDIVGLLKVAVSAQDAITSSVSFIISII